MLHMWKTDRNATLNDYQRSPKVVDNNVHEEKWISKCDNSAQK